MKLKTTSLAQAKNTSLNWNQTTSWLIEDYIPEQSFGCLVAPSNSYKSFQAVDWACSIATGQPWKGKEVQQGTVVYFALEGQQGINKRIAAWEQSTSLNASGSLAVIGEQIDMLDQECVDDMVALIKQDPTTKLVIIDTLARSVPFGDENSARDMGSLIRACDLIKAECGCTVMLVHHTGKDVSKGARGSSALYGAMDFSLVMERKGNLQYSLKADKQKEAEQLDPIVCSLEVVTLGTDLKGKPVTSLAPSGVALTKTQAKPKTQLEQTKQDVVEALQDGTKTKSELNTLVQASPRNKSVALKQLEEEGLIQVDTSPKKKQDYIFSLTALTKSDPFLQEMAEFEATLHQRMMLDFELADADYLTRSH